MRKVYLTLLVLGMASSLVACGGGASRDEGFLIQEGKSVVTEELKQANIQTNKEYREESYQAKKQKALPEGYMEESGGNVAAEILSKDGKYGVYSVLKEEFLIEARLTLEPTVYNDKETGFSVLYKEPSNNKWYFADGVGNILYSSKNSFNVESLGGSYRIQYMQKTDPETREKTLFSAIMISEQDATITYADPIYKSLVFKYDSNYVASRSTRSH